MAHNLTPLAVTNPSTALNSVSVPDAGDPRTAASVTTPMQALLNMINFIFNVLTGSAALDVTINGGIVSNSLTVIGGGNIQATGNVGATVDANVGRDLSVGRHINVGFGGVLTTATAAHLAGGAYGTQRARFPKSAVTGDLTGSTTLYAFATYDRVFTTSGTAAGGCTWQLQSTAAVVGEEMTLSHTGAGTINIKDTTGTIFYTLHYVSGSAFSVTVRWNGTGLDVVGSSWLP